MQETTMMKFDLDDLRLMVHTSESNSVTRGAAALHISVPAASARIRNLEDALSIKLLNRTSAGVTLTPPGESFVHHSRAVLAQIGHLMSDLQEYASGIKGHLRVFSSTTAIGEFLPPVMRQYLIGHPNINIDLREHLSNDIVRAVRQGQTDIGIVAGNVRTENLEVVPYRRDRLVLVVPRGHELATQASVEFADTLDHDHIGLHEASAIHAFLRQISDDLHRPIRQRIQVGSFEVACRMIEANVGIGVLPESAAHRHAQTMAIAIVPLRDDWSQRAMHICVRSMDALPAFARDLVALLVEDARAGNAKGVTVSP
jgi:DNA-binding transcriptional LysR family regulator